MTQATKIEWTDMTWNPVTGCTRVSAGCDHCYAARITKRFDGVHDRFTGLIGRGSGDGGRADTVVVEVPGGGAVRELRASVGAC